MSKKHLGLHNDWYRLQIVEALGQGEDQVAKASLSTGHRSPGASTHSDTIMHAVALKKLYAKNLYVILFCLHEWSLL